MAGPTAASETGMRSSPVGFGEKFGVISVRL